MEDFACVLSLGGRIPVIQSFPPVPTRRKLLSVTRYLGNEVFRVSNPRSTPLCNPSVLNLLSLSKPYTLGKWKVTNFLKFLCFHILIGTRSRRAHFYKTFFRKFVTFRNLGVYRVGRRRRCAVDDSIQIAGLPANRFKMPAHVAPGRTLRDLRNEQEDLRIERLLGRAIRKNRPAQ